MSADDDAKEFAALLAKLAPHQVRWIAAIIRCLAEGDPKGAALCYRLMASDDGVKPDGAILRQLSKPSAAA